MNNLATRSQPVSAIVLDDDRFQLRIMKKLLDRLGLANALYTDNADEAVASAGGAGDTLLFLDLNMPGTNGLQVMKSLAAAGYCGGIVLVSGHEQRILDSSQDMAVSLGLNVVGAYRKPLSATAVTDAYERFRSLARTRCIPSSTQHEPAVSVEDIRNELEGRTSNLVLFNQPKFDMKTGRVAGYEVLARWKLGSQLLSPARFIPTATESGQIHELSMLICRKALESHRHILDSGYPIGLSINFSIRTLSMQGSAERIVELARQTGIDPAFITIEITETEIFGDIQDYLDKLMHLIFHGVKLSIDDFGTGQSTLTHLKAIPFAELKVDRVFVRNAATDHRSAALFESSVRVAKQLGMQVVAEGGESEEDWNFARSLGCDQFQGYYAGKPASPEELLQLLEDGKTI